MTLLTLQQALIYQYIADKTRKMLEAIDSGKHIWILLGEILPSAKDIAKEYQQLFK
ncbi:hypothetical protein QUA20_29030 [Microcoleus sp. Pol7_A1]|uniref:hypothetical protein n=1 Tax=Microcoleus sp. Pol7_A1 TaxID=2818893 RepID=UPI002FCE6BAB